MKYIASDQQYLYWLQDQLVPGNVAYNIVSVFKIGASVEVDLLKKAIDEVLAANSIFSAVYQYEKGQLFCIEDSANKPCLELLRDAAYSRKQIEEKIRTFVAEPFSLSTGPLFRARLMKEDSGNWFLAVSVHHSVIDMQTRDMLGMDISDAYNSLVETHVASITLRKNSYADYAIQYRTWLNGDAADRQRKFWVGEYSKMAEGFNFPFDYQRPPTASLRGTCVSLNLSPSESERLTVFAREHQTRAYLILLTCYFALLKRYTGEDTITVGIPLTNRMLPEHKESMGSFMNIVPLSVSIDAQSSFLQLFQSVRGGMLLAHRHQSLPFLEMVNTIQPKRYGSQNPIFQTLFTFQHPMPLTLRNVEIETIEVHPDGSQLDFAMSLWESDDGIQGFFEYSTDLLAADTAISFTQHFKQLVNAVMQNAETPLCSLSLMSAEETNRVLHDWNATDHAYPAVESLHQMFERQVKRSSNSIAIEMPGAMSLTYREFNAKCNQLARYLIKNGVSPQSRIGVYLERSIEMVLALHAIEKANAVYVPLEPTFPPERNLQMIQDADIKIVISHSAIPTEAFGAIEFVFLNEIEKELLDLPDNNLNIPHSADDDAYIIFTSGSTGRPKGVLNHQKGITNRIYWMQDVFNLSSKDAVLQKTPFTFDVSVWEFFWPLMCGARLVVAPPEAHKDPGALCDLIRDYGITTIHFVPSMLDAFLGAPKIESAQTLHRIICSGEALTPMLQNKCFSKLPTVELHNLYGPTEAAVDVTHWKCDAGDTRGLVAIGRPISNTRIYILDSMQNPVPIGVPGELYIGGIQVAKGYVNRPDLTRERFIPDPFCDDEAAQLYKTGDWAKFRRDGSIVYLGRIDGQVKIHGLRIELEEIDIAILESSSDIKQAVTTVSRDGADARIVSYLVSANGNQLTLSSLQALLVKRLPRYMIPEQIIWLKSIPLSSSGKVERKALPDPGKFVLENAKGDVPKSDIERKILDIWKDLLKLDEIGVDRQFFDVGGTSILATHLVNRLNENFDVSYSPIVVFEFPTIRALAGKVATQQGERRDSHLEILNVSRERVEERRGRAKKKRSYNNSQ